MNFRLKQFSAMLKLITLLLLVFLASSTHEASSWTLQDAVSEIIKLQKQQQLDRKLIEKISTRVVPVGSVYIEYHGQPSPPSLWPSLSWLDISSSYAGLFFRAEGGDSEIWGTVQAACAPRITQMQLEERLNQIYPNPIDLPDNGWSEFGSAGQHRNGKANVTEGMRFHVEACEFRPKNVAIRIWKRIM